MSREHGTGTPTASATGQRGNHVLQGLANKNKETFDDDAERAAFECIDGDIGAAAYQVGGHVPALYHCVELGTGLDKWARVGPNVTTQAITMYVDEVNGLDTNDGLTLLTAFKTEAFALSVLPFGFNHRVHIKVKPHDGAGSGYKPFKLGLRGLNAQVVIECLDFTSIEIGLAAVSGNKFTILRDSGTIISDDPDLVGRSIQILAGGTGEFQRRTIMDSTTTEYLTGVELSPEPDGTSNWEAFTSATFMFFDQEDTEMCTGVGPSAQTDADGGALPTIVYIGWRFVFDGTAGLFAPTLTWKYCTPVFYGCEIDSDSAMAVADVVFRFSRSTLMAGRDAGTASTALAEIPVNLGLAADSNDWAGWGLSELQKSNNFFIEGENGFNALAVLCTGGVFFIGEGTDSFFAQGSRFYGGSFRPVHVTGRMTFGLFTGSGYRTVVDALSSQIAVLCVGPATVSVSGVIMSGDGGDLLKAQNFGVISASDTTIGATTGTGKAGNAVRGGKILLFGEPVLVGGVPGEAWSAGTGPAVNTKPGTFFDEVGKVVAAEDQSAIIR